MTLTASRWLTPLVLELRQLLLGEVVPALAVAIVGSTPAVSQEDVRPLTMAQLQGTDWLSVSEAAQRLHVKEQTLRELAAKLHEARLALTSEREQGAGSAQFPARSLVFPRPSPKSRAIGGGSWRRVV